MRGLCLLVCCIPTLLLAAEPATRPARPYAVAHDAPLDSVEKLSEQTDAYTRYRVEFNGIERGTRVPGYLYVPRDGQAKHPAVLMQYGSGGNKNTNYIVILDQMFAKRGFVVLTIDIPNKGERKVKGPWSLLPEGHFLQTLGDYSRSVDYLVSRPEVDADRLAYGGISWGAITGVTFVAHDPRIKAMASIVGGGNFLGWLPPAAISPETRKIVEQFDPYYHVSMIEPRPLLLLNVTNDLLVPRFLSESLQKAAGPHARKIWLNTDHFFSTVDRIQTCETVIRFVEENLPKPKASR